MKKVILKSNRLNLLLYCMLISVLFFQIDLPHTIEFFFETVTCTLQILKKFMFH